MPFYIPYSTQNKTVNPTYYQDSYTRESGSLTVSTIPVNMIWDTSIINADQTVGNVRALTAAEQTQAIALLTASQTQFITDIVWMRDVGYPAANAAITSGIAVAVATQSQIFARLTRITWYQMTIQQTPLPSVVLK